MIDIEIVYNIQGELLFRVKSIHKYTLKDELKFFANVEQVVKYVERYLTSIYKVEET